VEWGGVIVIEKIIQVTSRPKTTLKKSTSKKIMSAEKDIPKAFRVQK